MITSKEILQKTGIKNIKTLTRWQRAGLIPAPHIGTHPSGRGKIAYWPESVLDKCLEVRAFMKQGHTLSSAMQMIGISRVQKHLKEIADNKLGHTLEEKRHKIGDGDKVSSADILSAAAISELKTLGLPMDQQRVLLGRVRQQKVVELAFRHIASGYNPVLVFDGSMVDVVPDFMVGHYLSDTDTEVKPVIVIPLYSTLKKVFNAAGRSAGHLPTVYPSNKVCSRQGDAIVEYDIFRVGRIGFELIHEGARTMATVRRDDSAVDERPQNKTRGKKSDGK